MKVLIYLIRKYESLFKLSDVTKRFRSEKLRRCCVDSPETIAALYHGLFLARKILFWQHASSIFGMNAISHCDVILVVIVTRGEKEIVSPTFSQTKVVCAVGKFCELKEAQYFDFKREEKRLVFF